MSLERKISSDECFDYVRRVGAESQITVLYKGEDVSFDRYKLHIVLNADSDEFKKTADALKKLLDTAVINNVIDSYKILRETYQPDHRSRAKNLPYTIYLHNNPTEENIAAVVRLCQEIEKILKGIQAADKSTFSPADIPVSDHLMFRQTAFDEPEYIAAKDTRAALLAEAARHSEVYQALRKHFSAPDQKSEKAQHRLLRKTKFLKISADGMKNLLHFLLQRDWGRQLFAEDKAGTEMAVFRCLHENTTDLHSCASMLMQQYSAWRFRIAGESGTVSLLYFLIKKQRHQSALLLIDNNYVDPAACFDLLFDKDGDKLWQEFLQQEAKNDPYHARRAQMYQLFMTQLQQLPANLNVNLQFHDKATPLIRALQAGELEVARLLIKMGADFNTVLNWALENANRVVIENALDISKIHALACQSSSAPNPDVKAPASDSIHDKLNKLAHQGKIDLVMAFLLHGFPLQLAKDLPPHPTCQAMLANYVETLAIAKKLESDLLKTVQESKDPPQKKLMDMFRTIVKQRGARLVSENDFILAEIKQAAENPRALKNLMNKQIKAQLKNGITEKIWLANLLILQKCCRKPALMELTPQAAPSSLQQQPK